MPAAEAVLQCFESQFRSARIRHDHITQAQLLEAFAQMKPIAPPELRDAFERAKPIVLKLAERIHVVANNGPITLRVGK